MANNKIIDNGVLTDFTIATDEIGGIDYQITKLAHGALGAATLVSSASGLPVQDVLLARYEDAVHSSGDPGIQALAVRKDTPIALGADGDYHPLLLDSTGRLHVATSAASRLTDSVGATPTMDGVMQSGSLRSFGYATIGASASGNNTILAAQGVSNKILVLGMLLIASAAVTVKFQSGAGGTDLTGAMPLAANGGFNPKDDGGIMAPTAANTLLNMVLGGAVSVAGVMKYAVIT